MNTYDFIGCYFIVALVAGIIIFTILVMSLTNNPEKFSKEYSKRDNFIFCIATALTAVVWPVLIIYLFYLDYKDKERVSNNKRCYKKCYKYLMNAQIENTFVTNVLNFVNYLYYAANNIEYDGTDIVLTWYTTNGSRMKMVCDKNGNANSTIFLYDTIKPLSTYCYTKPDEIKLLNRIVEDFVDRFYDGLYT